MDEQEEEKIKAIVRAVVAEFQTAQIQDVTKQPYYYPAEEHYQDHMQRKEWVQVDYDDLRSLVAFYRNAKGLFMKAFVGFAIVGLLASIAWGAAKSLGHA